MLPDNFNFFEINEPQDDEQNKLANQIYNEAFEIDNQNKLLMRNIIEE